MGLWYPPTRPCQLLETPKKKKYVSYFKFFCLSYFLTLRTDRFNTSKLIEIAILEVETFAEKKKKCNANVVIFYFS